MLVLVMMRIDIDDQHVVELAPLRLLGGVAQKLGGVELVDGNAAPAISNEVHWMSSSLSARRGGARARPTRAPTWGAPTNRT